MVGRLRMLRKALSFAPPTPPSPAAFAVAGRRATELAGDAAVRVLRYRWHFGLPQGSACKRALGLARDSAGASYEKAKEAEPSVALTPSLQIARRATEAAAYAKRVRVLPSKERVEGAAMVAKAVCAVAAAPAVERAAAVVSHSASAALKIGKATEVAGQSLSETGEADGDPEAIRYGDAIARTGARISRAATTLKSAAEDTSTVAANISTVVAPTFAQGCYKVWKGPS